MGVKLRWMKNIGSKLELKRKIFENLEGLKMNSVRFIVMVGTGVGLMLGWGLGVEDLSSEYRRTRKFFGKNTVFERIFESKFEKV